MAGLIMTSGFWKQKKVLVTGYVGLLGSHLARRLLESKAHVIGLDLKGEREIAIDLATCRQNLTAIQGNVTDGALLRKVLNKYKITHIFHLAAEAIVQRCERDPLKTFSSNIEGTWTLLETCRGLKTIQAIVVASSDKAYGSHDQLPYREDASLRGEHFYDVSKSCADLIALAYGRSYGLPVAVTRCGNIFGPGDLEFSRIVPDAMRSVCLDRTLLIRSDGRFSRDYVYVDDIVDGYLSIAQNVKRRKLAGQAFNLSGEKPLEVLELVRTIYEVAQTRPKFKILNRAQHEIRHQYLSAAKIKSVLGWKPKHSLEEGLGKTLDWYREYF